ncbi:hypothetical protein HW276_02060 [Leptotrichia sp. oral taxon 417]|jgi:hypothetical protein|uniref:hypothetical protein n=1 Tax=Leptotrichia sp. oral taxon 417 TaxID=712365 RepID=UPI0015BB5FB8|nr:hypothetical protein [Leptotrichia sp. oral taxon 417]NWO26520.1 hypothetical protein [Leptotrichia sp. oral taxon 417]
MVKSIKLKTFFFKEYAQIAEKNTYSAYIPNGNRGIWCIANFEEKIQRRENVEIEGKIGSSGIESKKNKKNVKRKNLAKAGVHKVIEKYLENGGFSTENMKKIIQSSKDKVIFEKSKFFKVEKNNEKDFDSKNFYSQIVVIIDKDDMIAGNMGKTELALYRENRIVEKICGEEIKRVKLQKNDYLLAGSPEFWKNVDENEIEEVFVDLKSKENIEKNLSRKIKAAEVKLKKVIPFLSIFVENIEMEDSDEELEREVDRENKKREIAVKYTFLMIIFLFLFISVGKNIQRGNLKIRKEKNLESVVAGKIGEKAKLMENNLIEKMEIEKNKIMRKDKIGLENVESAEEKDGDEGEKKAGDGIKSVERKNKNAGNLEVVQNIEENDGKRKIKKNKVSKVKMGEKEKSQKRWEKVAGNEKNQNKKNFNVNNKSFKKDQNLKNNKLSQLDKEIERNWKILGRDRNGNNLKKI